MYRLESFEQMVEKGIVDQMNNYEYLLVERPKWIEELELGKITRLQIRKLGENEREVEISS